MSTKTTFKRLALVVVSALGFGMLGSVTPAQAADTASFSVPVTSVTVITPASSYDSSNANGAIFKITLRNVGTTKTSQTLQVGETLTADVVGVPAGTSSTAKSVADNASDLILVRVAPNTETTVAGNPYSVTSVNSFTPAETASAGGTLTYNQGDAVYYETTTGDFQNSYYLRVVPNPGKTVINQGEYTIRLRLVSGSSSLLVQETLVKARFVSSPIGAGFTLTAGAAGNFAKGEAALSSYSATKYLTATLRDANGGRVVSETTAGSPTVPSLTADIIDIDGTAINGAGTLTANDGGTTADFGITSSSTTDAANQAKGNNVYGITAATSWLDTATTAAAGGADKLRVRFGDKTATAALTINNTASGTATLSVSGVGKSVLTNSTPFAFPLTTKSVTFTVTSSSSQAGNAVIWTPTWTGCATGDRSHKSATAVTTYADADGSSSLTITCAAPTDGTSVSVAVTGFTTGATAVAAWYAPAANSMSVSMDGAVVALKSTNTFVATVIDRFGAPVSGVVLTPSVSTTGSNGSTTRTYTSLTTDANGQASYSLTDALAVAAGTDTVTFTHVTSGTAITAVSSTITYAATAPAPTSLLAFYNPAGNATQSVAGVSTPVPSTGIYKTGTTEFSTVEARDNTRLIATTDSDLLTLRVRAVEGAAVTATASTGAFIRGAAGTAVSSRTLYGSATLGDVYFVVGSNKTGANTITFTSGSVTSTAAFWVKNSTTDARFVTLTGPATANANGELQNYKVTVTDRYGNPVSGAQLSISASGVAAFGGGATLQTFTTGATGEFTFTGTSFNSAGGKGSFAVTMTNTAGADVNSVAGYVGTTAVESTLKAGNASATLDVTFAAGVSAAQAAADAAADAAAEAIDAANAATDAANLAAEAADAATVAAEEARDAADAATAAVEELATQVATLMAALKAQITTLANTVAKIAKKVKA